MKLVFLDIDGVLNSDRYLKAARVDLQVAFLGNEHLMFDPEAVARFNRLTSVSGAKVVISSSWRDGWAFVRLKEILGAAGVVGEIIGQTPTWSERGSERGYEIGQWLDEHNEGSDPFVILDDNDDMAHLWEHLVQTTWADGLLDEHVEEALRRFGC